jgi:hypothetical protein
LFSPSIWADLRREVDIGQSITLVEDVQSAAAETCVPIRRSRAALRRPTNGVIEMATTPAVAAKE